MSKKKITEYELAKQLVENMEVAEVKTLDKPENLNTFRQYLTNFSQKQQKKFTTKVSGDKIKVMRVEFFSF